MQTGSSRSGAYSGAYLYRPPRIPCRTLDLVYDRLPKRVLFHVINGQIIMQVHQQFSLLFYRKKKKADKQGYMPIYCRVTIDGLSDEMSTGCKVLYDQWDDKRKVVKADNPDYKAYNKKIGNMRTDLTRHFDRVVAAKGLALPEEVLDSYRTPVNGAQQREEKKENTALSIAIDELITAWVRLYYQLERLENNPVYKQARSEQLETERVALVDRFKKLEQRAEKTFDNPKWTKTLILAVNGELLCFFSMFVAGDRAVNTLKKMATTKARMLEVLQVVYKADDLPLALVSIKYIQKFMQYCQEKHKNNHNTRWKFTIILRQILNWAVAQRWIPTNVWITFDCKYIEPAGKQWPSLDDMVTLWQTELTEPDMIETRDIFCFQTFAGLSFAEVHALKPELLVPGIDGKLWTDQLRRKSKSDEDMPLLPICLEILEKYQDHPVCVKKGRCLPVLTDQAYNRNLKKLAISTDVPVLNNSHQARYVFANEIAHLAGLDDKTIGLLLGQRNPRTIKTYLKVDKRIISAGMERVETALYGAGGVFAKAPADGGGKVVVMRKVTGG